MDKAPLRVVCGIILHKGRVLATRRDPGRAFPLLWEFPGGKIEPEESAETALLRELEEELSFKVKIQRPLKEVDYQKDGHNLRLVPFLCAPGQEEAPRLHEHVELRWLKLEELDQVEWAPADVPIVDELRGLLSANS